MKIVKQFTVLLCLIVVTTSCVSNKKEEATLNVDSILELNVLKIKQALPELEIGRFPRNVPAGKKNWENVDVKDWCSGFWPGVLWYSYEYSGDEELKSQAALFNAPIKQIAYNSAIDHDIGFQVYCSFGNGYRLTGNPKYKEILLSAADTLATLYNPNVGSIHSWPFKPQYPHNTIIDNMMNLELLFWASRNGGDRRLHDIAESHAEVTMNNIVRSDGTTYHLGSFDDKTGEFIRGVAHQGYADESMWARGQTWGIYGFAVAHRETGRNDFLQTSIKLAEKYLERLPNDGIPFWDFDDPRIPDAPKDASAAAVASCGLLELSGLVKDTELKEKYINAAKIFLTTLSTKDYLSGDKNQALLLHSTGHHPKNSEIDVPIVYADYYFMEALLRLKKIENKE